LVTALLGAAAMLAPVSLAAAPVLRSGESVGVAEAQEVPDDFYAAGGTVTVSGTVGGDLYAAGGTVTINGKIKGDAVIAGGSVRIDGTVGDDVRVLGGEVVIAEAIKGDVLVVGGVVRILSTAKIGGDILFVGGEIDMDGELKGSLSGRAKTVRVGGPILGNVSVTGAQTVELGDRAHVEGTISYSGARDIVRAPGSVVVGDITKKPLVETQAPISYHVLPILAMFFTTLAYLFLFRRRLERLMVHTYGSLGQHVFLGFGIFAATPLVAVTLLASIVGLPVGFALLAGYLLLVSLALSFAGMFAGALIARYFDGEVGLSLKWVLLGTLALALVLYIPYVGFLLLALICFALIGGIATLLYGRMRS
jgi:cytoskeletal protein CcmA (bactofilin family)